MQIGQNRSSGGIDTSNVSQVVAKLLGLVEDMKGLTQQLKGAVAQARAARDHLRSVQSRSPGGLKGDALAAFNAQKAADVSSAQSALGSALNSVSRVEQKLASKEQEIHKAETTEMSGAERKDKQIQDAKAEAQKQAQEAFASSSELSTEVEEASDNSEEIRVVVRRQEMKIGNEVRTLNAFSVVNSARQPGDEVKKVTGNVAGTPGGGLPPIDFGG